MRQGENIVRKYGKYDDPAMGFPEQLTDALRDTIKGMVQGRDVAVAFSGGLDCGIVASITKEYARSVTLYTAGVKDAYDVLESKEVSGILELDWKHLLITEKDLEESVREMISVTGTVDSITLSFEVPLFYVSKYCKEDIIIGGQGADELFAGYSKYIGLSEGEFRDLREADIARLLTKTLAHESAVSEYFGKKVCYPYLDRRVTEIVDSMDIREIIPGEVRKGTLRDVANIIGRPEVAAKKKKAAQYGSGAMNLLRRMARDRGTTVNGLIEEWSR